MGRAEVRVFQRQASRVGEFLKERIRKKACVKIISHQDADGIASAAIMARCLRRYNVPFVLHFSRPKKPEEIAQLSREDYELFIFLDQGTVQLESIHKELLAKHRDVVIIDHHPGELYEHPNLAVLNPHLSGLNGGRDVSGSGATYCVVENLDLDFRSLLSLALIGAVGDRQEFLSGFTGVNDLLYKRAVDLGLMRDKEGLRLIGRSFHPVVECLRLSIRPFIPGISGNLEASKRIVEELDIRSGAVIDQLSPGEERALMDLLVSRAGEPGRSEEFLHTIWGDLHTDVSGLLPAPRVFREYAAMLDACANFMKPEIGFAALEDREALQESEALLTSYQEEMISVLNWFLRNLQRMEVRNHFKLIDCGGEVSTFMAGEAVSLLIESGLLTPDLPIMAISRTQKGELKISARGTPATITEGLHLGHILRTVAERVGGVGGGHDVAAAARIPATRKDEFLSGVDEALENAEVSEAD